jgi:hypothetical protein
MRRELFSFHLPNPDRVTADYAFLAALSRGLSGGGILNVCVNAIYAGSVDAEPERWLVTQAMLEADDWVAAGSIKSEMVFEGAGASWPWTWSGDGV